jgi:hypothetical protein
MLEVARAAGAPNAPSVPAGAGRAAVTVPPASAEELDRLARELKESDT